MPAAPDHAPTLAAPGRRRPPQRAAQKNSRRGFFGSPSGRTLSRRHLPHGTAPGYRACGYKTASGRPKWLSRDPLGEEGGLNLYSYTVDNPISWFDPFGLAPGDPYKTPDTAAIQAEKDINPTSIKENTEYAGMIYKNPDGSYSYTSPNRGTTATSNPGSCPVGKKRYGSYHTHGAEDPRYSSDNFSKHDIDTYNSRHEPGYVGVPTGEVKKYTPSPNGTGPGTVTVIATGVK